MKSEIVSMLVEVVAKGSFMTNNVKRTFFTALLRSSDGGREVLRKRQNRLLFIQVVVDGRWDVRLTISKSLRVTGINYVYE